MLFMLLDMSTLNSTTSSRLDNRKAYTIFVSILDPILLLNTLGATCILYKTQQLKLI
ncbi:hypothetical protein HanIR_Chr09g0419981 [Helianthus annuus]|nr:hypothetical protein HanIR_Chr09g0419981 [Helianthus annuus]